MKKFIALCLMACLLFGGCGASQTDGDNQNEQVEIGEDSGNIQGDARDTDVRNRIEMEGAERIMQALTPEGNSTNVMFSGVADEAVYHVVSVHSEMDNNQCVQYYVMKLKAPYEAWECHQINVDDWGVGEECLPSYYDIKPYVSKDGTVHMVLAGREALYLCQWNETAGASGRMIDTRSKLNELFENGVDVWYEDDNGEIYVVDGKDLYCFDEAFSEKVVSAPDGYVYQITENPYSGELYYMGASADSVVENGSRTEVKDGGFTVWKADSGESVYVADITEESKSEELGAVLCDTGCVAFSSETEGFLCNTAGIWQFSLDKSGRTKVYDYEANGIASSDSDRPDRVWATYRENGSLLLLTYTLGGEYQLHELKVNTGSNTGAVGVESDSNLNAGEGESHNNASSADVVDNASQSADNDSQTQEKQVVQIALTVEDEFLKQIVVDYNKQSEEYKIVIRTPGPMEVWDDYRTRIQAELSAGKGPALIGDAVLDRDTLVKQGFLEDLTEEFAEYEELMLPSVWAMGQIDGGCYSIPYTCSVITLVGNSDVIGERKSWTMEEAMQCMKESGAEAFAEDYNNTPSMLFFYMGMETGTNRKLVDWENKVCHFDSEEAIELLEFSKEYVNLNLEKEDEYERIMKGSLLTKIEYLSFPANMQQIAALLEGKEVYVGFPVEDGGSGHIISGNSFMVNQVSDAKDGAIDFVKYLLSEEVQEQLLGEMSYSGFPVRKDTMERVYENLQCENQNNMDEQFGIELPFKPLTDEQIDLLREIFVTARVGAPSGAMDLLNVMGEEMKLYYSGERSAEDVMDIVQNRAQLYMDENQ